MNQRTVLDQLTQARPTIIAYGDEVLSDTARDAMLARILASPRHADVPLVRTRARHTAVLTGAAAITVAVAGVAVGLSLSGSSPADQSGLAAGASIKAHLLSALDTTTDIVETKTTWSDGSYLDDWSNGAGTIDHLVQSGWPDVLNTVTSSGTTLIAMYPATKTWMTESNTNTDPNNGLIEVDNLRSRVQSGTLSVLATGVNIDGQDTTELLLTDPPLPSSADSDLWVNSSTDLPLREAPPGSTDGETDWIYYAPGSNATGDLTMPIPADYTQVPPPPGAIVPPGGKIPITIWNGSTTTQSFATCPDGGSACLTYPPTLPLSSSSTASGSTGTITPTSSSTP